MVSDAAPAEPTVLTLASRVMVDYDGHGKLVPGVIVEVTEHSSECKFDVMLDDVINHLARVCTGALL